MNAPYRLFFYGSLRTGEYNNRILESSTKLADGYIEGFELVSLGSYPCIVPYPFSKSQEKRLDAQGAAPLVVIGEVWDVDSATFPSIEGMELGAGYKREDVVVHLADGTTMTAGVYVYANHPRVASLPRVKSGDWCKRREEVA